MNTPNRSMPPSVNTLREVVLFRLSRSGLPGEPPELAGGTRARSEINWR
jgi:hypothetical protein